MSKTVILGAGGYVGSVLCPELIGRGRTVVAYDNFWFGYDTLPRSVWRIQGDIRDTALLRRTLIGCDAVIHLACISNDPSFDLNPHLGESINWTCFPAICEAVRDAGVSRFIYASSSSVYGIKQGAVTEDVECSPLTDYSKYKLMCEEHLKNADMGGTVWTILRPATVCGWSPRLRLDLVVNILTMRGLVDKCITVNGGEQLRPNIHIRDMVKAYISVLEAEDSLVNRQTFNVGARNASLSELAKCVNDSLGLIPIVHTETNDNRSYHIDSTKIKETLGFEPDFKIEQAIKELALRYTNGEIKNPFTDSRYHNVKRMKELFV